MTTREDAKKQCNRALFNAIVKDFMHYEVENSAFDVDNVVNRALDKGRPADGNSAQHQQVWNRMWTIFDEEWRRYELLPRVHP